jgi:hypothetical protein
VRPYVITVRLCMYLEYLTGRNLYDKVSHSQELQIHTQTSTWLGETSMTKFHPVRYSRYTQTSSWLGVTSMTRFHPVRYSRYIYKRVPDLVKLLWQGLTQSGTPDTYRNEYLTGWNIYDKVSPSQVLQIHKQADGNDIRPHTAQIYNKRTSTDLSLVTA